MRVLGNNLLIELIDETKKTKGILLLIESLTNKNYLRAKVVIPGEKTKASYDPGEIILIHKEHMGNRVIYNDKDCELISERFVVSKI